MLDGRQQSLYRPLVEAAWRIYSVRSGADTSDKIARGEWYRKELVRNFGIWSTREYVIRDQTDFDVLCLHFARLAQDDRQIAYWSTAEERRLRWALRRKMERAGVGMAYVQAIASRMGYQDRAIEDLPGQVLRNILAALSIYRRRHETQTCTST